VVSIAPGVFETPMMMAAPAEQRQALQAQVPFPPRYGRPEEFSALVEHVLANPMLNGAVIRLDGGLRMPAR
jgi:NAD(P)-dependent dehydrogenase (short-subunit alcohol dehydrogenase family)